MRVIAILIFAIIALALIIYLAKKGWRYLVLQEKLDELKDRDTVYDKIKSLNLSKEEKKKSAIKRFFDA